MRKILVVVAALLPALAWGGAPVEICNPGGVECAEVVDLGDGTYGLKTTATLVGGGDASAANQTAVQADPGSDATKAVAVQGVTGGKVIGVRTDPGSVSTPVVPSTASANDVGICNAATANCEVAAVPSVAGRKNCILSVVLALFGTDTGEDLSIVHGTGTACATNETEIVKLPLEPRSGTGSLSLRIETPWCAPADKAICVKPSAAIPFSAIVQSYESP